MGNALSNVFITVHGIATICISITHVAYEYLHIFFADLVNLTYSERLNNYESDYK